MIYVDDLLTTSESRERLTSITEALKIEYGTVTSHIGLEHDFLGIHWDFRKSGAVSLSMDGYVKEIMSRYKVEKKCKTPATDNLFRVALDSNELSVAGRDQFHSTVMTLHQTNRNCSIVSKWGTSPFILRVRIACQLDSFFFMSRTAANWTSLLTSE